MGIQPNGGKVMSQELYYTAPSDNSFKDMKKCCIKIWETYDNTYGYVDEKVGKIKDMKNVGDNFMYMFAMFDIVNQTKIMTMIKEITMKDLQERLD